MRQGGLAFFNQHEFLTAEGIADRLIPADVLSIGGKEAGDYGKGATLYRLGRFVKGTFEQGTQSALTPADHCRNGLVMIDDYNQAQFGKAFVQLEVEQQDQVLRSFEKSAVKVAAECELAADLAPTRTLQEIPS